MGSNHDCDNFNCEVQNYNTKIAHHPVPSFKFPSVPSQFTKPVLPLSTESTTIEHITTFFEDIVKKLSTKKEVDTTESAIITTTQQASEILNSTFSDIVGVAPNNTLVLDEDTTSSSVLIGVMESTSSSSFGEMVPIEAVQNGTELAGAMSSNGTILTTVSDFVTSTVENTLSIVTTTTEKAATFVTTTVNSLSNSTTMKNEHESSNQFVPFHQTDSHSLLYAILFIIVAILLLIGVILLLIYIRYRKNSFRILHNYYEVSPLNRNNAQPVSSMQEEQKDFCNDTYVQYPC